MSTKSEQSPARAGRRRRRQLANADRRRQDGGLVLVVVLRDHGGQVRAGRVIETDGPLFEARYSLKSGQWRGGGFDVAAIQSGAGPS